MRKWILRLLEKWRTDIENQPCEIDEIEIEEIRKMIKTDETNKRL